MTDKMLEAFAGTRKAGSIASGALDEVTKIVKPGVTTEEIDKLCYEFINDHKAYSAPLFYRGFQNHVVHRQIMLFVTEYQKVKFYVKVILLMLMLLH